MKQNDTFLFSLPLLKTTATSDNQASSFDVSLIDNVHSDIVRLRGFYGQLVIEGREVLLVEARSGADQIRWPIKTLKKWFTPKVAAKEDRNKIIVIITHK